MRMKKYGKVVCFENCCAHVDVKTYDMCKYDPEAAVEGSEFYGGVTKYGVFNASDLEESELIGKPLDEYDEYLKIWFIDDTTVTFRNSHVDMFLRAYV